MSSPVNPSSPLGPFAWAVVQPSWRDVWTRYQLNIQFSVAQLSAELDLDPSTQ